MNQSMIVKIGLGVILTGLVLFSVPLHRALGREPGQAGGNPIYLPMVISSPLLPPDTTRVSVASDGTQGDDGSGMADITPDGRYVAFASSASTLVAGDTNGFVDVFVHDRQTGETSRVSVATDGAQGNGHSEEASISADGRYIAFFSEASTLVPNDTNDTWDVFLHDRQTGQTSRISVAADGAQSNDPSHQPFISADGRYVAFASWSDDLAPDDDNGFRDVLIHDRQTGQNSLVSVASDGTQGLWDSWFPVLSADGRIVAFVSGAANLIPGDNNIEWDILVHDRQSGQTDRVSVASDGTQAPLFSYWPSISADGRYVAFHTESDNLVLGDTNDGFDVFVHDRQTGQTSRVSVTSNGKEGYGDSLFASISADGRYVTFQSWIDTLVPGDINESNDVFVHDRQTGQTTLVSVAADGTQGNADSGMWPAISADGRYVVFESEASNLVPGDTNEATDLFVRDRGNSGASSLSAGVSEWWAVAR